MKNLIYIFIAVIFAACSSDITIDEDYVDALVKDDNELMLEALELQQLEEWKPDVWVESFYCNATNAEGKTVLYLDSLYGLSATLNYSRGLNWSPQVSFYLSADTLTAPNPAEGHIYTNWITPASSGWMFAGAPYSCNPVEGPRTLGANHLFINPMFWGEGAGKRPFGDYYLIAVADQKQEHGEHNEINNIAFKRVTVSPNQEH